MPKSLKVIITIVAVFVLLFAGKNFIVKAAVERGVQAATGLPLKIKKLNIGILSTQVGIEDLSLLNPGGFPQEAMFHAPEIFVDYKIGAMMRGKMHLENVRLNFDRFVIVKNAQGQTNLDALKPKAKEAKPQKTASDRKKTMPEIRIDRLSLKVGKVIYKDYSGGGELSIREFNINISEELSDVTSLQSLLSFIATKALAKTTLNTLLDFNKDVIRDASAAPKEVVDTLKDTADKLKETIKLPFGVQ